MSFPISSIFVVFSRNFYQLTEATIKSDKPEQALEQKLNFSAKPLWKEFLHAIYRMLSDLIFRLLPPDYSFSADALLKKYFSPPTFDVRLYEDIVLAGTPSTPFLNIRRQ